MFSADLGGYTAPLPAATDPPFQKVALLLHGDGTNGAQNNTFVDYSYPGGYAVSFDGSGDSLSTSSIAFGTSDFCVEFWCYTQNISNIPMFLWQGIASQGWFLQFNASTLYFGSLTSNRYTTWSVSLTNNTWTHIAVTRSGSTLNVFINGVSATAKTVTGAELNNDYAGGTYIGTFSGTSYQLNGYVSNYRVVVGSTVYTSNFTPSNQPLTAVSGTQLLTCQSATIVDNSPNAFTITANGNAAAVSSKTITRTGNVAQGTFSPFSLADGQWSNYFDGTGDYLSLTDVAAYRFDTGDFTVETWVNLNSISSIQTFVSNYSGWTLQFRNDGTNRLAFYYSNTELINAAFTPVLGSWYHVACTRSGTSLRLFVNGALSATVSDSTNMNSSAGTLAIGYLPGIGQYTNGYISNVRLVKGTAVYTSAFTPSTTPLTAITNTSLLTCQSNRFKDNSSNNFTITPAGDTKVTAFSPFAPSAAYSASTNGGSAYFDGSGDYLTTPTGSSFSLTGDFTIDCFVYQTARASSVVGRASNGVVYELGLYTDGILLRLGDGSFDGVYINNTNLGGLTQYVNINTWNHIAIVRSGTAVAVYVNGISRLTATISGTVNNAAGSMRIGEALHTAYQEFFGYISNVRVIKGTAVYTANFTPPTAPLTAVTNTQLLLNCTNAGIIDNAGKNDIETVGNAQISTSVKKYGTGSMYFDGSGDALKILNTVVSTPFGTEDWTIEGWIYQTVSGSSTYLTIYLNGFPIQIYSRQSTIETYVSSSAGSGTYIVNGLTGPASSISTNTWTHFAFVKNGSNYKVYVNGIGGSTTTSSTAVAFPSSAIAAVGMNTDGSTYPFTGYIDDLRITKGQALYTSNFTPPTQAFPDV